MGNHWDFDVSIDRFEGTKPHSPLDSACWASYGLSVGECGKWQRNITEKLSVSHSYSCSFLPLKHRKPISQTFHIFASWSSYRVSWWVFREGWKYTISPCSTQVRSGASRRAPKAHLGYLWSAPNAPRRTHAHKAHLQVRSRCAPKTHQMDSNKSAPI